MSFDDHKLAPMFGAFKRHGRFKLFNGLIENMRYSQQPFNPSREFRFSQRNAAPGRGAHRPYGGRRRRH
jgi:hypothetical protein